ncbi:MAG: ROK family transcriptional regulator [Propionibacteriaceae bacterium]|jgi:predicted NBD/HSP70 family sugar kinase|nr:ROK family transcriptional regulator [Propionibacteriaceae bacterium]
MIQRSSALTAGAMTRAGQRSLREHNLSLVFSHVREAALDDPPSRADIADTTGLTKATVSSLVGTLIDAGLVVEGDPISSQRAGRPAIPLRLAESTVAALGLEVNVDFLGLRAIDISGRVLTESIARENLRGSEPEAVLGSLVHRVAHEVKALDRAGVRLVGASLALPGIADHPAGPLRLAPNLGWRDVDVRAVLASALKGLDHSAASARTLLHTLLVENLTTDNEANLAARVEIDAHKGSSFIYVSGEVGIGAAIVVDGRVFSGLHGWAGEIGHVAVDPAGPLCACGSAGCLEMYAGKRSLMEAAGLGDRSDVADLVSALTRGNKRAVGAVEAAADALGVALANCMNLVDVNCVVLGGDFAPLCDALAPGLMKQLSSRVLASRWVGSELSVRASTAGSYPAITGGAMAALDPIMANPASLVWG